ncbi:MAG: hypothetical protein JSU63_18565 [Phycisphaerales bacterium]|nr:MAG: hypothetical protein JSU63_18565 [Phycisphaerales bacterium]
MTRSYQSVCLATLLVAALVLRIGYCVVVSGLGESPSSYREYVIAGQRLLTHGTLVSPFVPDESTSEPSSLLPPAYATLVAGVYGVLGVETPTATAALKIVNALASTLVVLFAFLIARRMFNGWIAWLAAHVTAVNPMMIGFTDYIWDTSLFTLGVVLTVWVALRLSERSFGCAVWTGYGLFLGGLALLNPALTIVYPFLVLWPLHRAKCWHLRHVVRPVAASVLGWLVAITPWTVRNYVHFHELSYIRGGFGLELWLGVCPEADAHGSAVYRTQFPLKNPDVQNRVAEIGERAFIAESGNRAREAIAADPVRYLKLTSIRFVDYWLGTTFSHSGTDLSGWPRSRARAAVLLFMSAEVLLSVLCVCAVRRMHADVRWLAAIVLVFCIVYCLTHVQVRFRAPTEPLIAVILAGAVGGLFRNRKRYDPRKAA